VGNSINKNFFSGRKGVRRIDSKGRVLPQAVGKKKAYVGELFYFREGGVRGKHVLTDREK